jgi:hypothetical protein
MLLGKKMANTKIFFLPTSLHVWAKSVFFSGLPFPLRKTVGLWWQRVHFYSNSGSEMRSECYQVTCTLIQKPTVHKFDNHRQQKQFLKSQCRFFCMGMPNVSISAQFLQMWGWEQGGNCSYWSDNQNNQWFFLLQKLETGVYKSLYIYT